MREENFKLKKLKITNAGLAMTYVESVIIGDVASEVQHTVTAKDDVHPDMREALGKFQEIVRYDEGYNKSVVLNVTGITAFPSIDSIIITHTKEILSGNTARNSGKISFESEEFEKAKMCSEFYKALEKEAWEFIQNNKRAQLEIAFNGEGEDKAA